MPFDPDDPRLTAFALGELGPADRDAIEAILRDDPEARDFVVGVEETARLLADELRRESKATPGLDRARRDVIEERLSSPAALAFDPPVAVPPRGARFDLLQVAAAFAIVAVTLGLFYAARVYLGRQDEAVQVAQADFNRLEGKVAPKAAAPVFGEQPPAAPPPAPSVAAARPLAVEKEVFADNFALATPVQVPASSPAAPTPAPAAPSGSRSRIAENRAAGRKSEVTDLAASSPAKKMMAPTVARRGVSGEAPAGLSRAGMGGLGGGTVNMPAPVALTDAAKSSSSQAAPGQPPQSRMMYQVQESKAAPEQLLAGEPAMPRVSQSAKPDAGQGPEQAQRSRMPVAPEGQVASRAGDGLQTSAKAKLGLSDNAPSQNRDAMPGEPSKPGQSQVAMDDPRVGRLNKGQANAQDAPAGDDLAKDRFDDINRQVVSKQAELRELEEKAALVRRDEEAMKAKVDREAYARFYDNPFVSVVPGNELSTFAVDVDTASYANVRRYLAQGQLPPVDAVRIEELVNYFTYDDPAPRGDAPFSVNLEVAACPWDAGHRLTRIGLKGKAIAADKRPSSNLVFLIDVSGSMSDLNKLPLLKAGLKLLVEQLGENDRVGIVTYSSEIRTLLPSTPCHRRAEILAILDGLKAEGGTNGGEGIQTAYRMAEANLIKGGTNRVILATDGDFNLGLTKDELLAASEQRAKGGISLSVLGFGEGNLQDAFMEQLADKGNGNYSYIDTIDEARKVLVRQVSGTLVVIAKDVKIQVEFNPAKVGAYRLIGYENRAMPNQDFRDDKKDAGEIGAGHSVTALYEIVPTAPVPAVNLAMNRSLKYRPYVAGPAVNNNLNKGEPEVSPELLTVSLRYKKPDGVEATEISRPVTDDGRDFGRASADFRFASAVAGFGMLLRESPYKGSLTLPALLEIAASSLGADRSGDRKGFLELVRRAEQIQGPPPAPGRSRRVDPLSPARQTVYASRDFTPSTHRTETGRCTAPSCLCCCSSPSVRSPTPRTPRSPRRTPRPG